MTITIYITLIILVLISGLLAVSPQETKEKDKEVVNPIDKICGRHIEMAKNHLKSRLISLTVFVLSLASLMAMYFIKG